ncbi:Putative uncharacterized protein [Taphrina deformans PYCC 5710]|uniref:Peroxisomal D3,D2-enoyl-CoA isomerase n=1 Tax=Taphrina deformans (strain PYCC 5710 / ATCC 11124 / CBS 356.35 / IMI 108563 / JCM 9778 / NBRC 8474) TaxID=1097556 RepID=R4X6Z6_TAPDE|nr:Putative uncharacterized protein [Taphrina deformans PYCC 5710]|eukprot:CCG81006.1 Putative uncharacterized protein [Taphrina deformans PYCC 5710]
MSAEESAQIEREITLHEIDSSNGRLAIITLNRPGKYNALSGDHYRRLAALLHETDARAVSGTVLIGTGSFFSAGADVRNAGRSGPASSHDTDVHAHFMTQFNTGNLNLTHVFLHHRHPLFVCLNGPVIGMSAAIVAFADFIYATPETYLLTPFASLGLAPEGASSVMFPLKMGHALANRALLMSERITADELLRAGFISALFPRERFQETVVAHIKHVMEDKNVESMKIAKRHVVDGYRDRVESANVREVYDATDRFSRGIPQEQFLRLANKEKRHKL